GKSSLVYDTIFKESQRLYFSTFPSWSRKYLGVANRPKADSITGLDAAIAIDQKSSVSNPKSTVGTFSGIYDHLRLLFARFGSDGVQTGGFSRSLFSFNLETGWCEKCKGFGVEDFLDPDLIVADWSKSVRERALKITAPNGYIIYSQVTLDVLDTVFKEHGFSIDTPLNELTEEQLNVMFYGSDRIKVPFGKHTLESRMKWTGITVKPREEGFYPGFINVMNDILKRDRNANILRFVRSVPCSECNGSRLNPKVLKVLYRSRNIAEIADMTFVKLVEFLEGAKIKNDGEKALVTRIVKMMKPLINSGLSYLKLSRSADSLSTGEIQRIRISALSESAIRGATFIFDEPTAGLHGLESGAVIELIKKIRDNGNTVIAVEHDINTILNADNIIETGPGGGVNGGNIIFSASLHDFCAFGKDIISPTLRALKEKRVPNDTASEKDEMILSNCSINNLKNVTAVFKSGSINAICGVSGSGKRSLMNCLIAKFEKESAPYIKIDKTPIGRTPRSNPATYTGI
ncbi:MAG TPA: excinuclease ABC subunit UvrA, partial [bacterium]|nr:excinuclease ABC subunit UvrA [bacterium]